jgi:hypothetical protein
MHFELVLIGLQVQQNYVVTPGLTPVIRQSGSSVKGRPQISKIGNQKLRNLLFIYSFMLINTTRLAESSTSE